MPGERFNCRAASTGGGDPNVETQVNRRGESASHVFPE